MRQEPWMYCMVPEQRQGEIKGSSESDAAMWQMRQNGNNDTDIIDPVMASRVASELTGTTPFPSLVAAYENEGVIDPRVGGKPLAVSESWLSLH